MPSMRCTAVVERLSSSNISDALHRAVDELVAAAGRMLDGRPP
jgi:hypothetical protein